MRRWFQIQLLAILLSVAFFATYALASSETDLSLKKGEGAATISGWNISGIQYRLADDPSQISAVEFDLDGSATRVTVDFDLASNHASTCYNINGYHWLCEVSGVEIAQINSLRVVAIN